MSRKCCVLCCAIDVLWKGITHIIGDLRFVYQKFQRGEAKVVEGYTPVSKIERHRNTTDCFWKHTYMCHSTQPTHHHQFIGSDRVVGEYSICVEELQLSYRSRSLPTRFHSCRHISMHSSTHFTVQLLCFTLLNFIIDDFHDYNNMRIDMNIYIYIYIII